MKKSLVASFASVGFAALVAVPVMAADLSVRRPVYRAAPPPPPPLLFTWTGCFVGGHGGGLWATKDWFDRTPGSPSFGFSDGGHDAEGFLAGVQGGCNYQFGGIVVGIQGDYAWSNADGSSASVLFPGFTNHSRVESLGSVTGRVGYAWDRFLGYVKGGGAWERDNYDFTLGGVLVGSASETRGGWTVGIGGEYAFTPFLSAFVEYNYYDFGSRDLAFVTPGGAFACRHRRNQERIEGRPQFPLRLGRAGRGAVLKPASVGSFSWSVIGSARGAVR